MHGLAVIDAGITGYYLTLDSTCDHKKIAVIALPICMPNIEIINYNN